MTTSLARIPSASTSASNSVLARLADNPFMSRIGVVYIGTTARPPTMVVLDRFRGYPSTFVASCAAAEFDGPGVRPTLHAWQSALGWPVGDVIPNGYYLFIDGVPRAFDGAKAFQDDNMFELWLRIGTRLYATATDNEDMYRTFVGVYDAGACLRVIETFTEVIRKLAPEISEAVSPSYEVEQAFGRLRLPTTATKAEVIARQRDLSRELHPARALNDRSRSKMRAELKAVDDAVKLIRTRRGWE